MSIDLFAILKAVWGVITFVLIGVLRITYSDYKKTQERLDELDRDIIRIKAEMVTKEKLDEILDKKLKTVRDDVSDLRKDIKEDVGDLRADLSNQFKLLMENQRR
ncbi:conserved hypothetical membrane protein [Salmonella phage PVPSE1]|uniref:Uncharacterized protein n=4 Tax=Seunavirus TaxID=1914851 RepID=K4I5F2_9CAUD|nr:hypothetical protein PVP-SE1_gp043 [Salmonella phage PVPSE1]YP_009148840.1 hypothetical protein ACQ19_gp044 [Salmonella phage SSE121]ADP02439.1 conserved hypothetical membrane protein [Salmonella phage PVPSE1]AFU63685.1 hypothetical protein [Salmonella phage SSE121]QXL90284.1 hypothetical protein [Salmonella phage NINP13076]